MCEGSVKMKTMLEDFLEKHPKAKLLDDGTPVCCPFILGYEEEKNEKCMNCVECWNRSIENEKNTELRKRSFKLIDGGKHGTVKENR